MDCNVCVGHLMVFGSSPWWHLLVVTIGLKAARSASPKFESLSGGETRMKLRREPHTILQIPKEFQGSPPPLSGEGGGGPDGGEGGVAGLAIGTVFLGLD
jgi:hypothetical protein